MYKRDTLVYKEDKKSEKRNKRARRYNLQACQHKTITLKPRILTPDHYPF